MDGHAMAVSLLSGKRARSEEHTSELQSQSNLVCRLLLEKNRYARERALGAHGGDGFRPQERGQASGRAHAAPHSHAPGRVHESNLVARGTRGRAAVANTL